MRPAVEGVEVSGASVCAIPSREIVATKTGSPICHSSTEGQLNKAKDAATCAEPRVFHLSPPSVEHLGAAETSQKAGRALVRVSSHPG